MAVGKVYLVGAGPGDAGLLTLRGKRALAQADAVVLDHLAPARLLRYARTDVEVYDVGKRAGHHPVPQAEIEALLIRLARAGKTVVRLKGGDPFVFGRGAEEALALTEAGIAWEVVPGVTSAVAVPAYAGIPLTHRGVAPAFTVVTGHQCAQMLAGAAPRATSVVDWEGLARAGGTLVILMGVGQLPAITRGLMAAGRSPDTPAAAIQWGTRAAQRTVRTRLADLPGAVRAAGLCPPAIVVVGEAAAMPEALAWFERQPLFGRRIAVTGASQAEVLTRAEALEAMGAEAVALSMAPFAVVDGRAAAEWAGRVLGLAAAARGGAGGTGEVATALGTSRLVWWFQSSLGVDAVWRALRAAGADARHLAGVWLVAESDEAASALARIGLRPDVVVPTHQSVDGADMQRLLPAGPCEVWMEAVPALAMPVADALGTGLHIERRSLWQMDVRAMHRWLVQQLADLDEPVVIDAVWADSPTAAAAWAAVARSADAVWAAAPVIIGEEEAAVVSVLTRGDAATSDHTRGAATALRDTRDGTPGGWDLGKDHAAAGVGTASVPLATFFDEVTVP